jgi:hypothetical protein
MLNRQNAHALSKGVVDVAGIVATGQVVLMRFVVHSSPLEEFMYIMSMSMFMYHVLRLYVRKISMPWRGKFILDQWDHEN